MAQIFRAKRATKPAKHLELTIDSMDHQGRGVGRVNGKVCFVTGALTSERVKAEVTQAKAKLMEARLTKVVQAAPERVEPFCQHYQQCGGCGLQHQEVAAQLNSKQLAVSKLFQRFAGIESLPWQAPITSPPKHYRRSARIACIYDKQSKQVKLGFRAKQSKHIVAIDHCPVLVAPFDSLFEVLQQLAANEREFSAISHIQLCQADNHNYVLFRHTKTLSARFIGVLQQQLVDYQLLFDNGSDAPEYAVLPQYRLPEFELSLEFKLSNFIQVNPGVNNAMLLQSVEWLALGEHDKVLDLFCGVGNFSLVLAKQANSVVGVEGEAQSVAMAQQNAHTNQIDNASFHCFDLTQSLSDAPWFAPDLDVLVLDPSRPGALEVLQQLPLTQFKRILYVSCDPVTLARDSRIIVEAGFALDKIGLMNMFVHTGHIETMALFVRQ